MCRTPLPAERCDVADREATEKIPAAVGIGRMHVVVGSFPSGASGEERGNQDYLGNPSKPYLILTLH